jgi:hypothetical protein
MSMCLNQPGHQRSPTPVYDPAAFGGGSPGRATAAMRSPRTNTWPANIPAPVPSNTFTWVNRVALSLTVKCLRAS